MHFSILQLYPRVKWQFILLSIDKRNDSDMDVSYDYYKIFYTVAKYGSITAAAQALFLTQPTVSKTLARLEEKLGCTLFLRSKKGVSLTPEAVQLYAHIAPACEHILKAEEELVSRQAAAAGSIRIGASETTLHHFLLPFLERFRLAFPDVRLKIANTSTPAALTALRDGLIDCAVITSPVETEGLNVTALTTFEDYVIAGTRYADLATAPLTLATLEGRPLICLEEGTTSRRCLQQYFLQQGLTLRPDIELATSDLIVPLVRHNLGIGFVPAEFAREALQAGEVVRLELTPPLPRRRICLVTDAGRSLPPVVQRWTRLLKESAAL